MILSVYQWLKCLDCGHVWDDLNPDHEVCACFHKHGRRRSQLIAAGATNHPFFKIGYPS